MPVALEKRAIGVFQNREDTEIALHELNNNGFPINQVSVIAKDTNKDDQLTTTPNELIQDKTIEGIEKGALAGSTLGSITGLLIGLSSLAIPGIGPLFVAGANAAILGTLAGGFYGAVGGTLIGAIMGNGASNEEAKFYSDRLTEGNDLVVVDGNDQEVGRAESVLKAKGIEDWRVYHLTESRE